MDEITTTVTRRGTVAVLIAMCLGPMLSMFNSTIVNVTLPEIASSLHTSPSGLQWVSALYSLSYASMLLPGGALGSRLGRRAAFLIGVAVFVIGSAGCAAAPNLGLLLAARVAQALGAATLLPQTVAVIVHEYREPAARARAVGIWAGVSSLGLAAGPLIGGLIVSVASWRYGFVLGVVLGAFTLVLGWVAVPRERHGRAADARPIDLPGAVLSVIALASLCFGLIESDSLGWGSLLIAAAFVVAALAAAGFVVLELRVRHPIMPLGIWRSPGLIAANLAGLAYFFCFFGILYFFSIDLQDQRGFSALATGAAFLPMMVMIGVFGPISGRLSNRYSPAAVIVSGLVVAGIGCLLLAFLPGSASLIDVEWRLLVVGLGCGLMSSPMSNLSVSSADSAHSSVASAVHQMCRQIGSTMGVAVLGVIVASTGFARGLDHAIAVVSALLVVVAVLAFLLTRGAPRPSHA